MVASLACDSSEASSDGKITSAAARLGTPRTTNVSASSTLTTSSKPTPMSASRSTNAVSIQTRNITAASYYSHDLNLVLEFIEGESSVDDILALKSIPVRSGYVNSQTRVLAFVESDHTIALDQLNTFGTRLMKELPEYTGTRTAVVTQHIGPTTQVTKLAYDTANNQSIKVCSTLPTALDFLSLTREELFDAFPDAKNLIRRQVA